jgi:AAA domain/Domain of unknown function (DUF3854)/Penicillinase repressor
MAGIPLEIWEKHKKIFLDRAISPEFALLDGYRSLTHDDACKLGFGAGLGSLNGKSLDGIGIYFDPDDIWTETQPKPFRLRPDAPLFFPDGSPAKYLQRKNESNRLFEPHTNEPGDKTDPTVDLIITESELKATAIAENVVPRLVRKTAVVGLAGVNGGWRRPSETQPQPDGGKEKVKVGPPELIADFQGWNLKGRRVYIVFDSDVGSSRQAEIFEKSKSKTAGSMGAEYTLSRLVRGQGAEVKIVELPNEPDGSKNGADDYIVRYGWDWFRTRLRMAVTERNVKFVYAVSSGWHASVARQPLPPNPWILEGLYLPGTLNMDFGTAGSLKSWANLDRIVCACMGKNWLGKATSAVTGIIIDQESNDRGLKRRLDRVLEGHEAPDDIPLYCYTRLGLNFRDPASFKLLRYLIDRHQAGYVMLDSFIALCAGVNENAAEDIFPIFDGLRQISNQTNCLFAIIHHPGKTGEYRGSSAIPGALDLMLKCERKGEAIIYYSAEKVRDLPVSPFAASANFGDEAGTFTLSPLGYSAPPPSISPKEAEILEILGRLGTATVKDIAAYVEKSPEGTVKTLLNRLAEKGRTERANKGEKGAPAIWRLKL